MTEKIAEADSQQKKEKQKSTSSAELDQATIVDLVKAAQARVQDVTGPIGLLKQIRRNGS